MPSLPFARHPRLAWAVAVLATIGCAVHQRLTGPSFPLRGTRVIGGSIVVYRLLRSADTGPGAPVVVHNPDGRVVGRVIFRRWRSADAWSDTPLVRQGERLETTLPALPAAGKIQYYVLLEKDGASVSLTPTPVFLRYKGPVPAWILVPHILLMFMAMLLSNRAGLEALDRDGLPGRFVSSTLICLCAGGLVLGPLVQRHAFGALWTGFPLGTDLTDDKTALAALGWIVAWLGNRKGRRSRPLVLLASALTLATFFIPHSLRGSELDFRTGP